MIPRIILKKDRAFIVVGKALMKTREGIREGLHEIGIIAKRETQRLIKDPPKTGITRKIGGTLHTASAPGEAPSNLSGSLLRGVGYKVSSPTQLILGDKAPHGGFLQKGTRKMEARPHLDVAANNTAKEAENAMLMATDRKLQS